MESMPTVTRRLESTVNATKKSGLHESYHGAVERDEKRAVKKKTISVDCRSDSAADGRARDEKMKKFGASNGGRQRRKKKERKNQERKNILVSVPGFRNPPFPSSLSSQRRGQ